MDSIVRFVTQNQVRSSDGRYSDVEQVNYNDRTHNFIYRVTFRYNGKGLILRVEAKKEQGAVEKVAEMIRKGEIK